MTDLVKGYNGNLGWWNLNKSTSWTNQINYRKVTEQHR
jgi:hypothetical protein